MFIEIKGFYINFDKVIAYWIDIKDEEWHTADGIVTKTRYFLYIQYEGNDEKFCFEYDSLEEIKKVIKWLNFTLNAIED